MLKNAVELTWGVFLLWGTRILSHPASNYRNATFKNTEEMLAPNVTVPREGKPREAELESPVNLVILPGLSHVKQLRMRSYPCVILGPATANGK